MSIKSLRPLYTAIRTIKLYSYQNQRMPLVIEMSYADYCLMRNQQEGGDPIEIRENGIYVLGVEIRQKWDGPMECLPVR